MMSRISLTILIMFIIILKEGVCKQRAKMPADLSSIFKPSSFKADTRIVKGTRASIAEYPFIAMLSIGVQAGLYCCGATILNTDSVITAGHCFASGRDKSDMILVRVGTVMRGNGGSVSRVKNIIIHPYYQERHNVYSTNDIAIVKLDKRLQFTNEINSARMPRPYRDVKDGIHIVILGWGRTQVRNPRLSDYLMKASVYNVNLDVCRRDYSQVSEHYNEMVIQEHNLCAESEDGADACMGDSGGPAVVEGDIIVGITSWGAACGRRGYPGVYTKVSHYIDWIQSYTGQLPSGVTGVVELDNRLSVLISTLHLVLLLLHIQRL